MAVTITDAFDGPFYGDGITTEFPFEIAIGSASEIEVTIETDGVVATVDPEDYTVAYASETGTVTFDTAPADLPSAKIYITSLPLFTQSIQFAQGANFTAVAVNSANDRAAIRDIALKNLVDRSVKVPVGQAAPALPSLSGVTNKYLKIVDGDFELDDPDNFASVAVAAADTATTKAGEAADSAEQTALDRIATGEDRVQTGLDRIATAADRVQTGLDATATGSDRVQTGLDVTATASSAAAASAFMSQAELAAIAAGAPMYTAIPGDFTGIPSPFLLSTAYGVQVYTHNGTTETFVGWLGRVDFDTVANLIADTGTSLGPTGTIVYAEGFRYEVVTADEHLTTAGGVKLQVLPDASDFYNFAAWGPPEGVNVTTELQDFLDAIEGKKGIIPYRSGGYTTSRWNPETGTFLVISPGVEFDGLADGSAFGIHIPRDDVTIIGYGAKFTHSNLDISHTIYITNAKRPVVEGLEIDGPGLPDIHESDCVYVGGSPSSNTVTEDFTLRHIKAYGARRNILSITAAHRGLVENCEFSDNTDGTFKKGIDLEGNQWLENGGIPVQDITIRKTYVHDTLSDGILCSWSHNTVIEDCIIENAGQNGINMNAVTSIGLAAKNARTGDRLGVSAIDSATGWLTVSTTGGEKLIDDLGILPGYWVAMGTTGSGAYPTELSGYMCIEEISSDQQKIRVSDSPGYDKVTSTTGSGSGTLGNDPFTSELYVTVFRDGCGSKATVRDTVIINPGEHGVRISVSATVLLDNVEVSGFTGVYAAFKGQYSRDITIINCRVYGKNAGANGFNLTGIYKLFTNNNDVRDCTDEGFQGVGLAKAVLGDDTFIGCGADSGSNGSFFLSKTVAAKLSPKIHNGPNGSTRGLRLDTTTRYCLVTGADFTNSGTSNSTSISDGGSNNKIVNSLRYDGTWYV